MSVQPVLRMGDARLRRVAEPVRDFESEELRVLLQDMHDTMQAEGGVGLAAPQIGVNLQVVVFGFEFSARYPQAEPIPYTVLINPVLSFPEQDQIWGWEGCLSVPGLRGEVPRYSQVRYQGRDAQGHPIDRHVFGFHARVVQHECDHLLGILYPERLPDLRRFGFTDVLFPELSA